MSANTRSSLAKISVPNSLLFALPSNASTVNVVWRIELGSYRNSYSRTTRIEVAPKRSSKCTICHKISSSGIEDVIDLSQSSSASPQVHAVAADPGTLWVNEAKVAIDAPPDSDVDPLPEAQWTQSTSPTGGSLDHADQTDPLRSGGVLSGLRSGLCGVVSPRVLTLPGGGYRMYYSQILPRAGFPAGANDYDNSTTRILSAVSEDGSSWRPEPGVRLSSQVGGAGEFRVVSSEVVPVADGSRLRMYYECCLGPQSEPSTIRSAVSLDGGLVWSLEPGTRLEASGHNYSSPRILFLSDGRCLPGPRTWDHQRIVGGWRTNVPSRAGIANRSKWNL